MSHSLGLAAPGPRFNIKITSYQYRKSHCGDKTILWLSYLHNGISYTGKTTSLYWIWDQAISNTGSPCISILWVNASQATITDIGLHTFRPVFLGLPCFLMPGIWQFAIDLIQDVTRCTWLYHLSYWLQRTNVRASMPSFCSTVKPLV